MLSNLLGLASNADGKQPLARAPGAGDDPNDFWIASVACSEQRADPCTPRPRLCPRSPCSQAERYRSFLGLTKKDDWMSDNAARNMKGKPDFASPGLDMAAIEATRAAGMPADRFLNVNGTEAAADAAAR